MYQSYCTHCDKNWANATANCPHCGTPDSSASYDGEINEDTMDEEKEGTFRSIVADAMKDGVALGVAAEANNLITMGVKMAALSGGIPPKMLESAIFAKGTPVVGSLLILYLAETYPDLIPKSEFVAKAAKLALTEATKGTIEPLIKNAGPMFMALAASGESMAKLEAAEAEKKERKREEFESRINDDDDAEDAAFEIREVK